MNNKQKPDCIKCKFFYVTWDPQMPYGCKAIGFKGKVQPNVTVRKTSGKDCLLFQRKNTGKKTTK